MPTPREMRRVSLDLDEDLFHRLSSHLASGERTAILRSVVEDLVDLMDKVGPSMVLLGVTNKDLRIQDYTKICRSLKSLFNSMDTENELPNSQTFSNISPSPRSTPANNEVQRGEIQTSSLPSEEIFTEIIEGLSKDGIDESFFNKT